MAVQTITPPDGWTYWGCPECGLVDKFPDDRPEQPYCVHGDHLVWNPPSRVVPINWTPMIRVQVAPLDKEQGPG